MSINRIDLDLPTTTKIKKLNDQTLELNGLVQSGKFDLNELDHLYNTLGVLRKFKRNTGIGNTTTTYTSWSHLQAETGYSIWKFTPTNYQYNALNRLYMNNKVIENRGLASAESATSFDKVLLYNGDSGSGFTDNSSEASTEGGTDFATPNTINDYLYLGHSSTFAGVKFEWHTRGSNYTLKVEYYNGSSWTALVSTTDDLEDGTSNFQGDGHITWTIPSNWATTSVNSTTKYWIRISTTTNPITTARAYLIIPNTSVIGLLALSTSEILGEEWAWCSFNNNIYATIKNDGASAYEGTLFIRSSSTSANLQNFFVYNNPFTADYEDRTYGTGVTFVNNSNASLVSTDAFIIVNATTQNVDIDVMSAATLPGKEFIVKVNEKGSGKIITLSAQSGQTIDGAPTYSFSSDFECIIIKADGNRNWNIISKKS